MSKFSLRNQFSLFFVLDEVGGMSANGKKEVTLLALCLNKIYVSTQFLNLEYLDIFRVNNIKRYSTLKLLN